MEPGGVEPPSKRVAKVLSTCLVTVWLSAAGRYRTDRPAAYLLRFRFRIEAYGCYPAISDTSVRTPAGVASGEAPATTDLVCVARFAAIKLRMHKIRHLLAWRVSF